MLEEERKTAPGWGSRVTPSQVRAEAVRVELTKGCPLPVFETGAIGHYATPPVALSDRQILAFYSLNAIVFVRPYRLMVRTPAFQAENRGSIPRGARITSSITHSTTKSPGIFRPQGLENQYLQAYWLLFLDEIRDEASCNRLAT